MQIQVPLGPGQQMHFGVKWGSDQLPDGVFLDPYQHADGGDENTGKIKR